MGRRSNRKVTVTIDPFAEMRRSTHDDYVIAMREGRRQRAATIPNKRAVANKRAARGRNFT